jgi:hypothetical protein
MVILLALLAGYGFSVPEMHCVVTLETSQDLQIYYHILFACNPGADAIDVVDIGLPTTGWQVSDMKAWLDGTPYPVMRSTYISNGVEIPLGVGIAQGESGVLEFLGTCRGGVYRDDNDEDWASFRFSPTWFDGSILTGETRLILDIEFPPGSHPDSVRYHETPFDSAWVDGDRVVYRWDRNVWLNRAFEVGVGFPVGLVTGSLQTRPEEPPFLTLCLAPGLCFPAFFGGIFMLLFILPIFFAVRSSILRQKQYLPPKIRVGGKGVRRGLTVPNAALLMERPLDRVLMLVVWSLIKKGAVNVTGEGPGTKLTPAGIEPGGLRDYEKKLLELIAGEEGLTPKNLDTFFQDMIKELEKAMEGFNLKTTRDYYTGVMKNAWKQLEEAPDAKSAAEVFTDRFQWLLASENKPEVRLGRLPRPVFIPVSSWPVSAGATGQSINVAAACGNLVSRIESAAGRASQGLTQRVARVVNPAPVSSGSSRSGGGCACACACAGCACACAGGGR